MNKQLLVEGRWYTVQIVGDKVFHLGTEVGNFHGGHSAVVKIGNARFELERCNGNINFKGSGVTWAY